MKRCKHCGCSFWASTDKDAHRTKGRCAFPGMIGLVAEVIETEEGHLMTVWTPKESLSKV